MRNFKIEKNGTIRDDRGMRIGSIDQDYLRNSSGLRIAHIQRDKIYDGNNRSLGEVYSGRIKNSRGSTVGDISKIPLDYEIPVSPAMAAAIMHFFIKPILN
jgi:hypothetical protein